MSTTTAEGPTVSAPGEVPKPVSGELKGMDLAERKFARKLILPALITAILITQVPFLVTIFYSFQDWNLARPEERGFAGVDNYIAVVTNGAFLPALWATVWMVGLSMILSLLLGLVFAILLDRKFPRPGPGPDPADHAVPDHAGRGRADLEVLDPGRRQRDRHAAAVLDRVGRGGLDHRLPRSDHRVHPDLAVHARS